MMTERYDRGLKVTADSLRAGDVIRRPEGDTGSSLAFSEIVAVQSIAMQLPAEQTLDVLAITTKNPGTTYLGLLVIHGEATVQLCLGFALVP